MFFVVSKIYWILASPIRLLLIVAIVGVILSARRHAQAGPALALTALALLAAAAMTPLGFLLVAPLEDRFPEPPADLAAPDGIIVLGSAVNDEISSARGQTVLAEGDRATEAAILAKRYPAARVVYSGGSGSLIPTVSTEALAARRLLADLGVDPARVTLEDRSRNTEENARFTAALVHPQPSQRWLLVTSAFHMPRAMGAFEKAGFNVIAFPVGYRTLGRGYGLLWESDPARSLRTFEIALREWIGLAAYRATAIGSETTCFRDRATAARRNDYSAEGAPRR